MNRLTYQAIIIGYVDFAEEDRIVRLMTKEKGLISAIAKKARSSHRKFAGSIDIGNEIIATVSAPKQGELWKLYEAQVNEGRFYIRKDIHKIALMMYTCEVCAALSAPEKVEPKIFGLLQASLQLLENSMTPTAAYHIGFVAKALAFGGLQPKFTHCVICLKELQTTQVLFHPQLGGGLHANCIDSVQPVFRHQKAISVTLDWMLCLNELLHRPLAKNINTKVPLGPQWALCSFLENHIEKTLSSKSFLQQLYP
jgi:DNA repair protein RecO